jgi:hypothetical protein
MFIKGIRNNFDAWSGFHLFGPYVLADWYGWIFAVCAVVVWECADAAYCISLKHHLEWNLKGDKCTCGSSNDFPYKWLDNIFDRRGISWGDLLCGAAGIGLWLMRGIV